MIAGLILAAGESTRMGRDKATLAYRGRTFLEAVVETLAAAHIDPLIVVLGCRAREIARRVSMEPARAVLNPDYRSGQTSSLQAGLRALLPNPPEAVVLCLVDHPAVARETLERLVAAFRRSGAPCVIPTYQGRRGHPVLIGSRLFDELLGLGSDAGADSVVRKYRSVTEFVEVEDEGVVLDVDDPGCYEQLLSRP
jgi:molybdenum cofactor cytidylyltransferase